MIKLIEIRGVETPFRIKSITAADSQALMRKHSFLSRVINPTNYMEDFVFACITYPKFESKEDLLNSLLPGQYAELCNEVSEINGFEV